MEGENGLTASDVALLNGNNGMGSAGNSFIWIFGLLILMSMFNGGFGAGANNALGYENLATSNEVQRGFDNQNSLANEREILSAVSGGTAQAVEATNNAAYQNINVIKDAQVQLQDRLANLYAGQRDLQNNQSQCCCDTKMLIQSTASDITNAIQQNRYEAALNTASINDNTTAQTQKILDAMAQNQIADLQNQVNQLNLANQMAGVFRYPMSSTFAMPMPFMFPPVPPTTTTTGTTTTTS